MNWLERARREIPKSTRRDTANSAERNLTAVMAVPHRALWEKSGASIGSNGSTSPTHLLEPESVRDAYEERAAIMEFDGGLSRDEAEAKPGSWCRNSIGCTEGKGMARKNRVAAPAAAVRSIAAFGTETSGHVAPFGVLAEMASNTTC
jgi:hypothetical protein